MPQANNQCLGRHYLPTSHKKDAAYIGISWIQLYWDGPLYILRVSKTITFLSLKIDFVLVSSADPDEMLHDAAFHQGPHCLPKYIFRGFWSSMGYLYM